VIARRIAMTAMPRLVAAFHSPVGSRRRSSSPLVSGPAHRMAAIRVAYRILATGPDRLISSGALGGPISA
jgi:hypothetical protein